MFQSSILLFLVLLCNKTVVAIEKRQSCLIPKSFNERYKTTSRIFGLGIISGIIIAPKYVNAAPGAFEMDAGFYLKDILGIGNNKNQAISGQLNSMNSPILHSTTRQIDTKFANSVLNIVNNNIIPIADKLKTLKNANSVVEFANKNINYFSNLFRKRGIIISEDSINDRNYFDIFLLLYYIKASELIVESKDRVTLRQNIGENILELLFNDYSLEQPTQLIIRSSIDNKISANELKILADNISVLAIGIEKILNIFKSKGILLNYIYDPTEISDSIYAYQSFSYVRLQSLPVSFQLTLVEPATLLGFFNQAGANTFFHPEIVATTIAAYARKLGYRIRFEDYLMDNYYNSNPIGIQAQDIILEFGILS
eukprot:gene15707-21261_t